MEISFAVHKLAKFSANPGKVHFEGLVHLLRYIRDNKKLGLKYYAHLNDAPVTDFLRQPNIKTNNNLMAIPEVHAALYSLSVLDCATGPGTWSPFLTKCIHLEICLVCLVYLPFLAMHMADLLSKTIKGASFGTMSGSSFNNS